jgi:7-carboxy-7-deazaguanine synthase
MFGTNPIRERVISDGNVLEIQEIFDTIQGEGPYAGSPAVFVRLWGCNLRCFFCDTDFESNGTPQQTVDEIVKLVMALQGPRLRPLVVLTGGEPLRQNVLPLIRRLVKLGITVQIETAGTLWLNGLETYIERNQVDIVCSPKTPGINKLISEYCWHWKYIIRQGENEILPDDGLPMMSTQVQGQLQRIYRPDPERHDPIARDLDDNYAEATPGRPQDTIWLQPCDEPNVKGKNDKNLGLCISLARKFGYRLSLQQHKLLGLP